MSPSLLSAASLALAISAVRGYTWPDEKIDQLEGMLYEHAGNVAPSPAAVVFPCPGVSFGTGRNTAAEWLRTAYHDMATADVAAGTGGIDASIGFEVNRDENPGNAFNETLGSLVSMLTTRSSLADLIALGAIQAVGACSRGGILVPFRGGRIDATGPGPEGVPTPEQDIASHTSAFSRQGFNESEMIGLVACGHTMGGVHGVDFPEIVDVVNDTATDDNTQAFDDTTDMFDNSVASQFVAGVTQNPLAFGHNVDKRSDARIFNADGGSVIGQMASSNDFFLSTCSSLLERMINTVPKEVELSEPIQVIPVKPDTLFGSVGSDGIATVTGNIRLIDSFSPDPNREVRVHFRPRSGQCSDDCVSTVATTTFGAWSAPLFGTTAIFRRYSFSVDIPIPQGFSAFDVEVIDSGNSTLHTNGGGGFPFDDTVLVQQGLSCQGETVPAGDPVDFVIAVRDDAQVDSVKIVVYEPLPPDALVPQLVPQTVELTKSGAIPGSNYSLWEGAHISPTTHRTYSRTYDILASNAAGVITSKFNALLNLPACPAGQDD